MNNVGGTIFGSGGTAIARTVNFLDSTAGTANAVAISNSGIISGAVVLPGSDTFNMNAGGTVTGSIVGSTLATIGSTHGTVNFNLRATEIYALAAGGISNIDTVTINSGMVVANVGSTVASADTMTVGQSGSLSLNATISANTFVNNGYIAVGSNNPKVVGNFSQSPTGTLAVSVAGTSYPQMTVVGTASVAGTILLNFQQLSTIQSLTLVSASSIVATGSLTVATTKANPYYQGNPIASVSATSLAVNFTSVTPTQSQLLSSFNTFAPAPSGGGNLGATYAGLQSLFSSLSNNPTAGQTILSTLANLTPAQQTTLLRQLQPASLSSASALLASGLFGNGSPAGGGGRGLFADSGTQRFGMAAGDETGRGMSVWVRPYGESFHQGPKDGFDGFNAAIYGASAGADIGIGQDFRLGLTTSLSNADITYNGALAGNTSHNLSWQVGVYGIWTQGDWFIDGQALVGLNSYSSRENLSGTGSARSASF